MHGNNKIRTVVFFALVIFIFEFSELAKAQNRLQTTPGEFINYVNSGNFKKAADLFHYPPQYSQHEVRKDKFHVETALKSLTELFGTVGSYKPLVSNVDTISIQIGGGDLKYWSRHLQHHLITKEVHFVNNGRGFLIFAFCNINNEYVLREVKYGLPKSSLSAYKQITAAISVIKSVISENNP